jgi:hypothetical protein
MGCCHLARYVVLLAGIVFSFGPLIFRGAAAGAERLPDKLSSDGGVAMAVEGSLLLVVWTALFGLIFSSLACRIAEPHTVHIATKDALLGTTMGGFCLGVGLPLYSVAGKYIPAAHTNLLLLLEILLSESNSLLSPSPTFCSRLSRACLGKPSCFYLDVIHIAIV